MDRGPVRKSLRHGSIAVNAACALVLSPADSTTGGATSTPRRPWIRRPRRSATRRRARRPRSSPSRAARHAFAFGTPRQLATMPRSLRRTTPARRSAVPSTPGPAAPRSSRPGPPRRHRRKACRWQLGDLCQSQWHGRQLVGDHLAILCRWHAFSKRSTHHASNVLGGLGCVAGRGVCPARTPSWAEASRHPPNLLVRQHPARGTQTAVRVGRPSGSQHAPPANRR